MDGRQFVQEQAEPGHYQLVVQDAVNDLSVPYHIMTKEYNYAVKRLLTPDGIYLLPVIDEFEDGLLIRAAVRDACSIHSACKLLAAGECGCHEWNESDELIPGGQWSFYAVGSL